VRGRTLLAEVTANFPEALARARADGPGSNRPPTRQEFPVSGRRRHHVAAAHDDVDEEIPQERRPYAIGL
jgi:hypothetical protein